MNFLVVWNDEKKSLDLGQLLMAHGAKNVLRASNQDEGMKLVSNKSHTILLIDTIKTRQAILNFRYLKPNLLIYVVSTRKEVDVDILKHAYGQIATDVFRCLNNDFSPVTKLLH